MKRKEQLKKVKEINKYLKKAAKEKRVLSIEFSRPLREIKTSHEVKTCKEYEQEDKVYITIQL